LATQPQTLRKLLRETIAKFRKSRLHYGHGTHNAGEEATWLFCHVLDLPWTQLPEVLDRNASAAERKRLILLTERRLAERIPVAYLIHEAWLGEYRFYVDERTIVPRSFIAELLHDGLAPWVDKPERVTDVLDMCTGSGCLAILAALNFGKARVDAADISAPALTVAKRNVSDYKLQKRLRLLKSDLFANSDLRTYDLIISNPPYVNAASMRRLPAEYRHEPELALASGTDGLDATRGILRDAKRHLKPGGMLIVEIGHNRRVIEKAFPRLPFTWLEVSAGEDFVFMLERAQLP
jgi:ribosomal protein L3 glutamine methyltransferase